VITFPAVAFASCVFTPAATPLPTRDLDQSQHDRSACQNTVRNSIALCFSSFLLIRNLTRERPPCLNEKSCLRITPRRTGRCGLQLELPVRARNSIRLSKVYRHETARSHEAEEAKPAIYGPCGVMACTLGIFLSKSIYLKVAVRICAEPFFFFFAAVYACDNVSSRGLRVVCFHTGRHASSNS
jgi:hypothetical protein